MDEAAVDWPVNDPATRDAMFSFALARLREEPSPTRREALWALMEETIRPYTSADSPQGRVARRALALFVGQWSIHPDWSPDWSL